jgi:hypothetical protein
LKHLGTGAVPDTGDECCRGVVSQLKCQSWIDCPFELVERARFNGNGSTGSVHNTQR